MTDPSVIVVDTETVKVVPVPADPVVVVAEGGTVTVVVVEPARAGSP